MVAALRSQFGPLPDQSMHEKTPWRTCKVRGKGSPMQKMRQISLALNELEIEDVQHYLPVQRNPILDRYEIKSYTYSVNENRYERIYRFWQFLIS